MEQAQDLVRTLLVYALPVLFAITAHEAAHGYVARLLGDPTAADLGRVTLNPASHIDPIGTVVMPVLLYVMTAGTFVFGYAKPVPVDWRRLRQPKRDMVWVAVAGPAANLLQMFTWALFGTLLIALGVEEPFLRLMAKAGVLVNLVMFAFNLLPVPPLDGGRVLVGLLPKRAAMAVARVEPYGFFIVMALILAGLASTWWMLPVMRATLSATRLFLPQIMSVISVS